MAQVPLVRPKDAIKAFKNFGWQVARQKGSHIILTKQGNIATLSISQPQRSSPRDFKEPDF